MDDASFPSYIPKIPAKLIIRKEHFGALLFDRDSLAVIEINDNTLGLLHLIDGQRPFCEIAQSYAQTFSVTEQKVMEFLKSLLDKGLIEC
ncbi:MAG: hypothetical protein JXR78_14110 [Victivallales bacterium]|nr:hypothetical protein [Victivallales bacterium]